MLQFSMLRAFAYSGPSGGAGREMAYCMLFDCYKVAYPTDANITPPSYEIGFDAGPEDLGFGEIPIGSNSKRFIELEGEEVSRIIMTSSGNISEYIHFSPASLLLDDGEKAEVRAELRTEPDMKESVYTGTISVARITPRHSLLRFMLGWL